MCSVWNVWMIYRRFGKILRSCLLRSRSGWQFDYKLRSVTHVLMVTILMIRIF